LIDQKKIVIWLTDPDSVRALADGEMPRYHADSDEHADMEKYGWVRVGTLDVDIPRPDEDWVRVQFIKNLRNEQDRIHLKAQEDSMKVEKTIQQLLSLGYNK
jgi:hypothetical protein